MRALGLGILLILTIACVSIPKNFINEQPKATQPAEEIRIVETPKPEPKPEISCDDELSRAVSGYLQEMVSDDEMYAVAKTCPDPLIYHRIKLGVVTKDEGILRKFTK